MEYKYITNSKFELKPVLNINDNVAFPNVECARKYVLEKYKRTGIKVEKIKACCEGKLNGVGIYSSKNGIIQKFIFRYLTEDEVNEFIKIRELELQKEQKQKEENIKNKKNEPVKYYLYTWTRKDNNTIFYVGYGKNGRWKQHNKHQRSKDFIKIYESVSTEPKQIKFFDTKEEALQAEEDYIKYLIEQQGYSILNERLNINLIENNDKILVNKTSGGKDELKSMVVDCNSSHENRSNAQKKYANSEVGKKQKSKISKEVQNRQEVKDKKNKAIKNSFKQKGIHETSEIAFMASKWPENIKQNCSQIHCIELNKTFLTPAHVLPYMMENFNTYILGEGIPNAIKESNNGFCEKGTISIDDIATKLTWRIATKEEVDNEMKKYKEEFNLRSKIGDIEGTIEQELLYLDYIDFLEETNLLNSESRVNEEYLPNRILKQRYKIINLDKNQIESKNKLCDFNSVIDIYGLEEDPKIKYKSKRPSNSQILYNSHKSFQYKMQNGLVYCVTTDKIFLDVNEAAIYYKKLTGKDATKTNLGKAVRGYEGNHKYGKYNGEVLLWDTLDLNDEKSKKFIKHYNELVKEYIIKENEKIEKKRIDNINILKEKLKQLENEFGLVRGRNKKTNELKIQEFTCDIKEKNTKK